MREILLLKAHDANCLYMHLKNRKGTKEYRLYSDITVTLQKQFIYQRDMFSRKP